MISYEYMTNAHISQVAELEKICFHTHWSENAIAGELINPLSLWIVAVDNGNVIGYVGSQSVLGEADMMNLAVDERYRRQGIGRCLVETLVFHLKQNDVKQLTLEVRKSNVSAISLYGALGFTQVGYRPNYYTNPKEDALILRKEWGA